VSDRPFPSAAPLPEAESSEEYAHIRRTLVKALRLYCPGWLAASSEDLAQTAAMRVLEARRKQGEGKQVPNAYLYRAAYTALVNEIRRRRRMNEVSIEEDGAAEMEGAQSANPERTLSARELGESIERCLGKVTRERKLAVTLHLQGYTVEEAARLLRFDRKRTENLVYRGMADLRECLSAQGIKP
jgi:RNA polymerase sigma-70 factor, ECF subfamily